MCHDHHQYHCHHCHHHQQQLHHRYCKCWVLWLWLLFYLCLLLRWLQKLFVWCCFCYPMNFVSKLVYDEIIHNHKHQNQQNIVFYIVLLNLLLHILMQFDFEVFLLLYDMHDEIHNEGLIVNHLYLKHKIQKMLHIKHLFVDDQLPYIIHHRHHLFVITIFVHLDDIIHYDQFVEYIFVFLVVLYEIIHIHDYMIHILILMQLILIHNYLNHVKTPIFANMLHQCKLIHLFLNLLVN